MTRHRTAAPSVGLDGTVDVADEHPARVEPDGPHHQEEPERDNRHVQKVESRLQEAAHAAVVEVVEEAVRVDEGSHRPA